MVFRLLLPVLLGVFAVATVTAPYLLFLMPFGIPPAASIVLAVLVIVSVVAFVLDEVEDEREPPRGGPSR